MLEEIVSGKNKTKHKPYALFLLWKNVEEILVGRIRAGVRGRLDSLASHPENFKLFSFIKEIEETSTSLQEWAELKSRSVGKSGSQSVEYIYPKSITKLEGTPNKTNRFTSDSTALASCMNSKHDKRSTVEDFNSRNSEYLLFRASTAKLSRKELKMHVRCPSAAQVLKDDSFKPPNFEFRNSKKSIKHKSELTEELQKYSKFRDQTEQLKKLSQKKKSTFNISNICQEDQDNLNISILQKEFEGNR
jgi:hypothetical protein